MGDEFLIEAKGVVCRIPAIMTYEWLSAIFTMMRGVTRDHHTIEGNVRLLILEPGRVPAFVIEDPIDITSEVKKSQLVPLGEVIQHVEDFFLTPGFTISTVNPGDSYTFDSSKMHVFFMKDGAVMMSRSN